MHGGMRPQGLSLAHCLQSGRLGLHLFESRLRVWCIHLGVCKGDGRLSERSAICFTFVHVRMRRALSFAQD